MRFRMPNALSLSPTKRKSSDASWAAWAAMLAVTIAASAAFVASEVALMRPRAVKFLNVRAGNAIHLRNPQGGQAAREATLGEKTPLVYFLKDSVVVGTIASAVAPANAQDVLLLARSGWRQGLERRLAQWSKAAEMFPSPIVAIGFEQNEDAAIVLEATRQVVAVAALANRHLARAAGPASAQAPAPVLVRIPWGD